MLAMAQYLGADPVALMPIEVGGMNTLIPLATAAELGLPVIDADSMRRAFPQIEMTVFTLAGLKAAPCAWRTRRATCASTRPPITRWPRISPAVP